MKAAIYHHAEKGTSPEETAKQLSELEQFCKTRGFDEIELYNEKIESDGRQRPVFIQLIKDANRRKFDTVVVWSFRNFRRYVGIKDIKYIIHLRSKGIMFVSYREPFFDTSSSQSGILLPMLEWLVEDEARTTSSRTKAGIEKAKRQGIVIGRPKVDMDTKKVLELREKGATLEEIAETLGTSKETVRRTLMRTKQEGETNGRTEPPSI